MLNVVMPSVMGPKPSLRPYSEKLHFLPKLQIGSISYGVCPWQAFPAWCNVTLSLIAVIRNLQRKLSVVNTPPGGKHL